MMHWQTAHTQLFVFCTLCVQDLGHWSQTGQLKAWICQKTTTKKKPKICKSVLHHGCFRSFTLNKTDKPSAPSLCPKTHFYVVSHSSIQHTFMHHIFTTTNIHTQKIGISCILKIQVFLSFWNPDAPLLECKIPGDQRVRCQFEDVTSLPCLFPPQSSWLGSERESNSGYDAGEGREGVVGAAIFLVAIEHLVTVRSGVTCTDGVHFVPTVQ